jgi:hypothetical protein
MAARRMGQPDEEVGRWELVREDVPPAGGTARVGVGLAALPWVKHWLVRDR